MRKFIIKNKIVIPFVEVCKWNSRRLWILWRWILEGCGDCVGGILEVCGYFMYLIFFESRGGA